MESISTDEAIGIPYSAGHLSGIKTEYLPKWEVLFLCPAFLNQVIPAWLFSEPSWSGLFRPAHRIH